MGTQSSKKCATTMSIGGPFFLCDDLLSSAGPRDLPLMVEQPGHHVQSDQYLQLSVSAGTLAATFVALR